MKHTLCSFKGCRNEGRYCRIPHSGKAEVKEEKKPLKRTPLKKKPTKIKKASKKRAKEDRLYSQLRRKFLIQHPVCQFEECEREATDVHHTAGRMGKRLLDFQKCKALCRDHHHIVELNPEAAKEKGLSKSRHEANYKREK